MGKAASDDRFVFIGSSSGAIVGNEFGKVGTYERDYIASIGVEYKKAFRISAKGV